MAETPTEADAATGSRVRGHVDVAEPTRISGWAFDPDRPESHLTIELVEGGEVIGRTLASQLRTDLRDAGVGTGQYGFSFTLTDKLLPFGRHVVRLRIAGGDVDLPASPTVIERPGGLAEADPDLLRAVLRRRLDAVANADELGRFVALLADAMDAALAQRFRVGQPVLAPQARREASDAPAPVGVRAAIEQMRERFPDIAIEPAKKPVVSIVIASRDQFADAHACIASIAAAPPAAAYEVILVDDASTDEALLARAVLPQAVRLFRTPARGGEVRALRAGQALAQGRYVLFLDPRARLARGAVDAMLGVFEAKPEAGIVGARIHAPDGRVAAAGVALTASGGVAAVGQGLAADDPRIARLRDADAVLSHAMMVEKALWMRLHGFDEAYADRPHADADLCLRARKAGRGVFVSQGPAATMALAEATLLPDDDLDARSRFAEGRRLLLERWKDHLAEPRYAAEEPLDHGPAKRALVIDHAYPTPHLDAGSGAILSHMRALQSLGHQVLFVPGGPPERHPTATAALQALGVECYHAPFVEGVEDLLTKLGGRLDVIYIHRYPNAAGYLEACRRLAPQARIVYSVADLHFLRAEREAAVTGDEAAAKEAAAQKERELALLRQVDAVITHSSYEADVIREAVPEANVHVVPWTTSARPVTRPFAERAGVAFIGGYDHAPNRDAARWLVDEVMPLVHREAPDIHLQLVGAGLPADFAAGRSGIHVRGWVEDLHEELFSCVRLTVAPLRFGAGLKGKVLESLVSGVACVMTPCAAEGLPRMTSIQPWIVNGPEAFARAIIDHHKGLGATTEALDAAQKAVAAMTDAGSVASALSRALAPSSPTIEQQPAALASAGRE